MRRLICLFSVLAICISLLYGCSKHDIEIKPPEFSDYCEKMSDVDNPVALINVRDFGYIVVELYYDKAPNTVKNFISLAKSGFYNELIFHRVISGFMIQGGDPNGNGTGGPGYNISGEFSNNRFKNDVKHTRGVISMARRGDPYNPEPYYNTAGSQFFIMIEDNAKLDGDYAAFGFCIQGIDIVDKIAAVSCNSMDKPLKDVVIESITIVDHGFDYGEPEKIL